MIRHESAHVHDCWLCDDGEHVYADIGDVFTPAHDLISMRVVHVSTNEPIEPGSSGNVLIGRLGFYRVETTCVVTGLRGRVRLNSG